MTEEEARGWFEARYPSAKVRMIEDFLRRVIAENDRQNLIAPSTTTTIWQRHALDSAQLVRFDKPGVWLDIGAGGGFPGIVVAMLRDDPVTLIEPRSKRAAFLADCVDAFALDHVDVFAGKVERSLVPARIISARAVASLDALFASAQQCAGPTATWVLPKGRNAAADLAAARQRWSGMFHMEQSIVEPGSSIVIAEKVARR